MGNSLRRPPPPSRRHHPKDRTLMDLWNTKIIETKRRCKRKRPTNIESLPDDLLFEILQHLPPEDIYDVAMLVCPKWYNIIHTHKFIYANLHRSTPGLLINYWEGAYFLTIGQGNKIEISELRCEFEGSNLSSCNGLILASSSKKKHYGLHITNPVTKQKFAIPRLSRRIEEGEIKYKHSGIGYSASSMVYKVVCTYKSTEKDDSKELKELQCAILTLGVDESWRHVSIGHLSDMAKRFLSNTSPFITEGFMHWSGKDGPVLALNVETEIITENPIPRGYESKGFQYYLSTGKSSLSLLVSIGKFSFDVWNMKPETGEWTKLYKVDLEDQHQCNRPNGCSVELIPVGWLRNQEVLVLHDVGDHRNTCIAYNVCTKQIIDIFELDYHPSVRSSEIHTNSLVWLAGS